MRAGGYVCSECAEMSYIPKEQYPELFQQTHIHEAARLPVVLHVLNHY